MTPRERVKAALGCQPTDRTPWVELANHPPVVEAILGRSLPAQITNHSFPDQKRFEEYLRCLTEFSEKLGIDAVLLKFWTPAFAETRQAGTKTCVRTGLIRDEDSLKKYGGQLPEPVVPGTVDYDSAVTYNRIFSGGNLARGFQIGGIYGFAEVSVGYEEMCLAFYDRPEWLKRVIAVGAEHVIETARRLLDLAELDFLILNDDLAFKTGPLISPAIFREFFLEHFARLGNVLKKRNVPFVCHTDGDFTPLLEMFLEAGIQAIHPCEPAAMDIFALKDAYGDRLCLMGNLDVDLLVRGTPQQVREQGKSLLQGMGDKNGHIFSSGNCIMPETPLENIQAMAEAHRLYAARKSPAR